MFTVILALFASMVHTDWHEPPFTVELRKADDSVEVMSTDDTALVTITSTSGIGGAKLIRTREKWPTHITIRLKLSGLESFRMENRFIRLNTFLGSSKRASYWKIGHDEKQAEGGTLEIVVTQTNEAIEVVVPGEMIEGNPEGIRFDWIDFFRE